MSDVDEVKSKLNIVDLIGEKVTLKKAGRNFKGLCPFHKEKSPSFMVSPDRQVFHCFGCGKGGSAIDFIMEYHHLDFAEALEELADRVGVTLTHKTIASPQDKERETLFAINTLASEYFQYILTKHPLGERALLYLKNRGIGDRSIKTFGIGYSPNSWDALIRFLQKKRFNDRLIEKAGLSVKGRHGWYDRFRGRVMFTLRDHRGRVAGFSGRVLDPNAKEAKYINTPETPVYVKSNMLFGFDVTKDAIARTGEAILTEGEFDCISSFQAGVSNVVAIKGSALTEGHLLLLKRFAQKLVFCLDSDSAGDIAARRGIDAAEHMGFDMKAIILPGGKDPDEAVRTDPVGYKKAVKEAIPIYDFFMNSLKKRYDLTSSFDKKKASEEFLPFLSRMSNAIVQGHYVKAFARLLDVSEETITEGMRRVKIPLGVARTAEKKEELKEKKGRLEQMELQVLAFVLQGDTLAFLHDVEEKMAHIRWETEGVRQIFEKLKAFVGKESSFTLESFGKTLPQELLPLLDEAYLFDLSQITEDEKKMREQWQKALHEYIRLHLRAYIKICTDKLKESPDSEELQKELGDLGRQLSALEKSI